MWLFDTDPFPARWHCGTWTPLEGWVHILSDLMIAAAYFAIPAIIALQLSRRHISKHATTATFFALFIASCGLSHAIDAAIFWLPIYRVSGLAKLVTAAVSVITVMHLIPSLRQARIGLAQSLQQQQIIDGIFEYSSVGKAYVGLDGRILRVNDALCRFWERDRDDVLAPSFRWQDITPEPDLGKDMTLLKGLLERNRDSYSIYKRYIMPDEQTMKWAKLTVWRVDDSDNNTDFLAVVVEPVGTVDEMHNLIRELRKEIEDGRQQPYAPA